jgi:hypothetical protein
VNQRAEKHAFAFVVSPSRRVPRFCFSCRMSIPQYQMVDEEDHSVAAKDHVLPPLVSMSDDGGPLGVYGLSTNGNDPLCAASMSAPLQSLTIGEYVAPRLPVSSAAHAFRSESPSSLRRGRPHIAMMGGGRFSGSDTTTSSSGMQSGGKGSDAGRITIASFPSNTSRQVDDSPSISTANDASLARGLGLSTVVIPCDKEATDRSLSMLSGSAAILARMPLPNETSQTQARLLGQGFHGDVRLGYEGCLHEVSLTAGPGVQSSATNGARPCDSAMSGTIDEGRCAGPVGGDLEPHTAASEFQL